MADILSSLTADYGLGTLALILGISGSYLISRQKKSGFFLCAIGCLCGFLVAVISARFGFVFYNAFLLAVMLRGYIDLSRRPPPE